MTPKEKAKELFDDYKKLAHHDFHHQTGFDMEQGKKNAISCALIAVREVLDSIKKSDYPFWVEVKKELKTL